MDRLSRKGTSEKNFITFILLVVLIGSSISSIGSMGLTISPQYAWAAVPSQPSLSNPADGVTTDDTTPTLQWGRLSVQMLLLVIMFK